MLKEVLEQMQMLREVLIYFVQVVERWVNVAHQKIDIEIVLSS